MNSKSREQLKYQQGFTLIETIVAILIFGIASVGFTYAYMSCLRVQVNSEHHYAANNLARNRISRALTLGYDSMWVLGETDTRVNADGEPDTSGDYLRTTTVTAWGTNANEVVVTVDWPSIRYGTQTNATLEARTVIALGM